MAHSLEDFFAQQEKGPEISFSYKENKTELCRDESDIGGHGGHLIINPAESKLAMYIKSGQNSSMHCQLLLTAYRSR